MKLIVVHGDHVVESRERLQKFTEVARKRGWEIERIYDNTKNLKEVLVSNSLFNKDRLVIIENFKLINKGGFDWLKKNTKKIDGNVVIYHEGELSKTALKKIPNPEKVEEFKLPKLIWTFLDSIYPDNAKHALVLLHELIENEPVGFVFALLSSHMRDVYWAKVAPETIPYPSWRVGKLKSQARKFSSEDDIAELIEELAQADIKAKTSQDNLTDSLDFIIASELE